MEYIKTDIEGVVIIEPEVHGDGRGYFAEIFSEREFAEKVFPVRFVQENESQSRYGVVRALHYQLPPSAQGKLVRVVSGAVLDVAVDIRHGSPTFGRYVACRLDDRTRRQMFIPRGFAHGFLCLTEQATVVYKCDNYYSPAHEGGIIWNDPQIGIEWGIGAEDAVLSEKDRRHRTLSEAPLFDYSEKLYRG